LRPRTTFVYQHMAYIDQDSSSNAFALINTPSRDFHPSPIAPRERAPKSRPSATSIWVLTVTGDHTKSKSNANRYPNRYTGIGVPWCAPHPLVWRHTPWCTRTPTGVPLVWSQAHETTPRHTYAVWQAATTGWGAPPLPHRTDTLAKAV
jgi:hypothetical protein